jgi:prolyl oligopeptidase PreP (S9A serine peptidase family)
MDIQHLVDSLEQVLNDSTRVPLSAYLIVNEEKVYSLLDQMRVAVPEEIKRANRIEAEKDRILAQAKEEAERIRELARQEAGELVRRDAIVNAAQNRAENIIERSRRDAEALRQDADVYIMDVLNRLEEDLTRTLKVVQNGLQKVEADQQAALQAAAQAADSARQGA